jgi:predicted small integral membrane protein
MLAKNDVAYARLPLFLLMFGWGLLHLLVAFGNLTDYGTNFEFVKHVLSMDTIFPNSTVGYRAISLPWVHHLFYACIIFLESLIAVFGLMAAYRFFKHLSSNTETFAEQKKPAYIALALGILLWFISFSVVGAEWFSMWQSADWNAVDTANRLLIIDAILYALVLRVK